MKKPHVSVVALVHSKEDVLMVRRGDPPFEGRWSLPGGHLEFGEGLEETAIREVYEETGLKVRISNLVGFKNVVIRDRRKGFHLVLFCYEAKLNSGSLRRGTDVKDAAWKNPKVLNRRALAPPIVSFLESRNLIA